MKLLFVYNANSGLFSAVMDSAHKVLSPDTYECNLCKLTYGNFKAKKTWIDFLKVLNIEKTFLHKNDFEKKYPNKKISYPIILIEDNGNLEIFLDTEALNKVKELDELIEIIQKKLINLLI